MSENEFKSVFITGGAGYAGSALVPRLLKKGYKVTVYDLFIYEDTLGEHENLTKIKADIRDKEKLIETVSGHDAAIHLACISNDPSFDLDPELGKSINFDGFKNVVSACVTNKVKRLIVASSTAQYGIKPIDMDVTEDTPADPITDYAKFKIECENYLVNEEKESRTGDLEYVFVRPSTLCGYAPRLRLDLSVNILTSHALINKKIKVFGGTQVRPALHVEDMAKFYELMLSSPKEKIHGKAFNVSYGNLTMMQIGEMVHETLDDKEVEIEVTPSNDDRSYHVNADKIAKEFGWKCDYTLQDAVLGLRDAFNKGLIKDGINNPMYHNIKRMKELNLK